MYTLVNGTNVPDLMVSKQSVIINVGRRSRCLARVLRCCVCVRRPTTGLVSSVWRRPSRAAGSTTVAYSSTHRTLLRNTQDQSSVCLVFYRWFTLLTRRYKLYALLLFMVTWKVSINITDFMMRLLIICQTGLALI